MKITKEQLKTIIREELKRSLAEARFAAMDMPRDTTGVAQAGLGQKPKSRLASVEPAAGGFEGVGAPKTRGEARMMARKAGELSYTWNGKKYGTRGSAETRAQWKKKMAARRAKGRGEPATDLGAPSATALDSFDREQARRRRALAATGGVLPGTTKTTPTKTAAPSEEEEEQYQNQRQTLSDLLGGPTQLLENDTGRLTLNEMNEMRRIAGLPLLKND